MKVLKVISPVLKVALERVGRPEVTNVTHNGDQSIGRKHLCEPWP